MPEVGRPGSARDPPNIEGKREVVLRAAHAQERGALAAAVAETERYIRDELEDARSFSLDSPKELQASHRRPPQRLTTCPAPSSDGRGDT
jgi:hypothetical protein